MDSVPFVAVVLAVVGCVDWGPGDGRGAMTVPSTATASTSPASTVPPTSSIAVVTSSSTPATVVPTSLVYPALINDTMIVEDGYYATVDDMAQAADLVVVGDVVGVESLGRPSLDDDPWADEYVALTVDVRDVLKGARVDRVVLGWDAILVDPDGERVATILSNGIRPPAVGDQLLLFLDPAPAAYVESLGGRPTHSPVLLDGVAFLDGDRLVAGETVSTTAEQLLAMSLPEIRRLVRDAAAHPRDVGDPIRPGGL